MLQLADAVVNPLVGTGNYSATSNNMKLVHWPLMGGLSRLVQRGVDWAGPQPTQTPPLCSKCNSPPINGQCTNHRIAAPLLCSFNVPVKGLMEVRMRTLAQNQAKYQVVRSGAMITCPVSLSTATARVWCSSAPLVDCVCVVKRDGYVLDALLAHRIRRRRRPWVSWHCAAA